MEISESGPNKTHISDLGVFLDRNPAVASTYAKLAGEKTGKGMANVMKSRVRMGKTAVMGSVEGAYQLNIRDTLLDAKDQGFDSVVIRDYPGPLTDKKTGKAIKSDIVVVFNFFTTITSS